MAITVNEGGVLYELNSVYANEGGVLYELNNVYANESGVLYEIHGGGGLPKSLTWTANTSKDSAAKINSTGNSGLTINYTCQTSTSSNTSSWDGTRDAIISSVFSVSKGTTVTFVLAGASGTGTSAKPWGYALYNESNQIVFGATQGAIVSQYTYTFESSGKYYFSMRGHSVTGSRSGTSYYPLTATVNIAFTK